MTTPPPKSRNAEAERLRTELDAVLSDWNALVKASGSPTNGGAIGHVAAMAAEVERLRAQVGLHKGGPHVLVHKQFVEEASARVEQLKAEVERLRSILRDVAGSGVQLPAEPPGLSYATVQIDGELWERIGKEFGQ